MSIESKIGTAKTVVNLAILGAVGYGLYKGYEFIKSLKTDPSKSPALAVTLDYWGISKIAPGVQIPDTTGNKLVNFLVPPLAVANAATNAYVSHEESNLTALAGNKTEYAYDQALSHFAANHGFPDGATAAASEEWPCDPSKDSQLGFTDWADQGFPELPL